MKAFAPSHATILLLDSDSTMRTVLHDVLQAAGYLVMKAGDLGSAVDRLSEARPDLLITRPYINSMPGRVAADYLRGRRPGLPVLIVAGYMDEDRLNVQNTVEQFYTFPKPFGREDLLAKVRDVLSHTQEKAHSAHKEIA
jgi:DNA-binding NtrC family response regulator